MRHFANPDFVNTSEAYSFKCYNGSNCLIIPYINIDLMPLNPIDTKKCFIDFSYFVFRNVRKIIYDGRASFVYMPEFVNTYEAGAQEEINEDIVVGSWKDNSGIQVNIQCQYSDLYIHPKAQISTIKPFTPYDTPNFKGNMIEAEINAFFDYKNLPDEIKKLL